MSRLSERSTATTSARSTVRRAALSRLDSDRLPQDTPNTLRVRQPATESGVQTSGQSVHPRYDLENALGQGRHRAAQDALAVRTRAQATQQPAWNARRPQSNPAPRLASIGYARQSRSHTVDGILPDGCEASLWEALPGELYLELVESMAETQPRDIVVLYQTDGTFRDTIDRLGHSFYTIQEPGGTPVEVKLPLIEYARLATNFGARSPLELFLSMALCVVKALANTILHTIAGPSNSRSRGLRVSDMVAPVSRLLGGDTAFQLAQWYVWVSWRAIKQQQPDTETAPINAVIQRVYGWTPQRVYDARSRATVITYGTRYTFTVPIGHVSAKHAKDAPNANEMGSDTVSIMTRNMTKTQLGHLFPNRRILDDLFGAYGINPGTAGESVRRMLAADAQEALRAIADNCTVNGATGACARAIASSPHMPTLMQLNSGLTLVRFDRSGASINVRFQSNAIEWALAAGDVAQRLV